MLWYIQKMKNSGCGVGLSMADRNLTCKIILLWYVELWEERPSEVVHKEEPKTRGRNRCHTTSEYKARIVSPSETYCDWAKGVAPRVTKSMYMQLSMTQRRRAL
jgi:hypothetical protein